jgi:urease accessory protein
MPYVLTQRLSHPTDYQPDFKLLLTAEERTRTRYRCQAESGEEIYLNLPRGTVLRGGDCLIGEPPNDQGASSQGTGSQVTSDQGTGSQGKIVQIVAKAEPVITVRASTPLGLMRSAYHLGNRHGLLEIGPDYLRLSPDPVLEAMLHQLGVEVVTEVAPFEPERGAYGHAHHH